LLCVALAAVGGSAVRAETSLLVLDETAQAAAVSLSGGSELTVEQGDVQVNSSATGAIMASGRRLHDPRRRQHQPAAGEV
jgi:hypothetical protein